MAVTQSQTKDNGVKNFASGRYLTDATAAAITVTTGFKPRYVKVVNNTSRDGVEWFEGMTDAHGFKTVAAGTRSAITSNGITPSERGFIIGLDTDVNVINEQLSWVAFA